MAVTTFAEAVAEVASWKDKGVHPSNDVQLAIYANFKIAKGETIGSRPWIDPVGKAKFDAWEALINKGVTKEQAEAKYVQIANAVLEGKSDAEILA
ncbi:hypothetical protein GQ42DRAFT_163503 [Ramicandelaber brevisporus]|nr:hypothetical protein GQ42DRAFT_163503 [Ramicandelaber brevisporus]